jgi:putative ABC transport system substrate-binding protein
LAGLAADLVDRRVAVIATITGDNSADAAKAATTDIPVVFVVGGDPVQRGLIVSLNRPGGNLTGVTFLATRAITKRLELLSQLMPAGAIIGVLVNPDNPNIELNVRDAEKSAQLLHNKLVVVRVRSDSTLESPIRYFAEQNVDAVLIDADPYFLAKREQLVGLAQRYKLPAIYSFREFATVGGLMSYGTSLSDAYHQVGNYVGRILHGEKPADLPVVQSARFEFVINLKTAQSLGFEFPAKLLSIADEVIE